MNNIILKLKFRLRLSPFLYIRNKKAVYEDPDGVYDVYELFERVFPFVYRWTGTWTPLEQNYPPDVAKLRRIIMKYQERGHV